MTDWQPVTTATPIYCHWCMARIVLPGTYKIVSGYPFHNGCPGFAALPVTIDIEPGTEQ